MNLFYLVDYLSKNILIVDIGQQSMQLTFDGSIDLPVTDTNYCIFQVRNSSELNFLGTYLDCLWRSTDRWCTTLRNELMFIFSFMNRNFDFVVNVLFSEILNRYSCRGMDIMYNILMDYIENFVLFLYALKLRLWFCGIDLLGLLWPFFPLLSIGWTCLFLNKYGLNGFYLVISHPIWCFYTLL